MCGKTARTVRILTVSATVLAACRTTPVAAPTSADQIVAHARSLESLPLFTFTEDDVDVYVRLARQIEPDLGRRVVHLGRKNLGQPYEIYLLGEFPYEFHDPDPLYCLERSDCLVFAEHMYAMALSNDWWSFLRALQRIRYRDGDISMLTRNHYTIADWNRNNAFLFADLTMQLGNGRAHVPLHQVCGRAAFFAKFGLGQDIPDEPVTDAYIPAGRVPGILSELRDGDFVNIIRGNDDSQYCGHTGLIARRADDVVDFLHSTWPAVREEPLLDVVTGDKSCLGIKILRLRPDAEALMARELASTSPATEVSPAALRGALSHSPLMSTGAPVGYADRWKPAVRLQSYRLTHDTPVDSGLQATLEQIDARLGHELDIPPENRACGVLDLSDLRLAMVRPDDMFYGASVPKIGIVMAYFATHPDAATQLDPQIEHELQLVLKRSDNDLAAKYSQLVGLEKIQEILQSRPYRFYDRAHGGGIWCGKHYGLDAPRTGDPVADLSHAVTVRQCLRYYLLLEQGRLVNATVSAKLKQLFAAPALEFHDDGFVRGLNGRNVTILRKNGLWEDWHLDTARIQHGDRLYLLAAVARNEKGDAYLQRLAAAIDEHLCGSQPPVPFAHQLIPCASAATFGCPAGESALHESPIITPAIDFNEVLLSWNVDTPEGTGFSVELRVGRQFDDSWSPWLYVADWGTVPNDTPRLREFELGRIDVDYFRSSERFDRLQYRIRAHNPSDRPAKLCVARVAACVSDLTGIPTALPRSPLPTTARPVGTLPRQLPVPFRSQATDRPELAGRLCNPTSVAMLLAYRGVDQPVGIVADRCYDPTHGIYGNWPRSIQAAYSFGVPGYATRLASWTDVEQLIAQDQPLVISIMLHADDVLRGAPYRPTAGHLIVLTGFDEQGRVRINDPAFPDAAQGRLAVHRDDLEKAWMRNTGGVTYVLLPPD